MGLFDVIGSVAGNVVGGLIGKDSAEDAANANANLMRETNAQNIELQREFATQGIRWKVNDAVNAGLHPLAALGAQTLSFTPVSVGAPYQPDNSMGTAMSAIGQDISRALHATRTGEERRAELEAAKQRQDELDKLNLERHRADLSNMELQNQLLASQIKRLEVQSNPPFPSEAGAGKPVSRTPAVGAVKIRPSEITSRNKDIPSLEAGSSTPGMKKYYIGGPKSGGVVELPGQQMSEALESAGVLAPFYVWGHNASRALDHMLYGGKKPPVGPGYDWQWNRWKQRWDAVKTK